MKKRDIILIAAVLILAGGIWLITSVFFNDAGGQLRITVNNEIYGTYDLKQDQEIPIGTTNTCIIKDGKVTMIQADCPDHICMHSAAIDKDGGTIVCMPNRVFLEIVGQEDGGVDAIAQ